MGRRANQTKQKFHLGGFMEAWLASRFTTRIELNKLTEEEHRYVFGISREERRRQLQQIDSASNDRDWTLFESPRFLPHGLILNR